MVSQGSVVKLGWGKIRVHFKLATSTNHNATTERRHVPEPPVRSSSPFANYSNAAMRDRSGSRLIHDRISL